MIKAGHEHGVEHRQVAETIWVALTADHPKPRYAPAENPFLEQGGFYARLYAGQFQASRAIEGTMGAAPQTGFTPA